MSEEPIPHFEERKNESALQVLFRSARLLNEWALARWNERRAGKPPVRASHTSILPHLDVGGTRLTTIAERMGISKQAVAQLVAELEEMGFLQRRPDPEDGRAKLIFFSGNGLEAGLSILGEVEEELKDRIGQARMTEFKSTLDEILRLAESRSQGRQRPKSSR